MVAGGENYQNCKIEELKKEAAAREEITPRKILFISALPTVLSLKSSVYHFQEKPVHTELSLLSLKE